jgi:hypothetical protein
VDLLVVYFQHVLDYIVHLILNLLHQKELLCFLLLLLQKL